MPSRNFTAKVASLLERHGIEEPPVDLERIAFEIGAQLEYPRLGDSLSGFLALKDGERVIGINARHHRNRQRFTLAHEIAHLLLGHETGEVHVDKGIVLLRDTDSASQGTDSRPNCSCRRRC
jgi:hypothetical protein